jgi:hypothetical protein
MTDAPTAEAPTSAILVKAPSQGPIVEQRLGLARVRFKAEPLFENIPPEQARGFGAAGGTVEWQRLTLEAGDDRNPWDLAHSLTRRDAGFGASAQGAVFAEPDLLHQWLTPPSAPGDALGAAAQPEPQRTNFPRVPGDNLWFRDKNHSGFNAIAGGAAVGAGARIAHIDTGYDPDHVTRPKHLLTGRARNFVERGNASDAVDHGVDGLMTNPGHGTGTLALLASAQYGGAPGAEVLPLRIANGVVLFSTSALARAFDHVYGLRNDPATRIDVITMSMGGVASQAWAEAINRLYEAGVFIVTAAGNNYGNLPTHNVVFPARFGRVLAACGVMADGSPYADLGLDRMAGNYGPDSKMKSALSAPTPNVPWAVRGSKTLVNWSGQGTSCATPQIAAAAAIWIAKNRAALDAYPKPWMKVEAVRRALYDSATQGNASRFGRGLLQADEALALAPVAAAQLKQEQSASAEFAILRLLTGLGAAAPDPTRMKMLELEALQLSQSPEIAPLIEDPDATVSVAQRRRIFQALADHPKASRPLKAFVAAGAGPAPRPARKTAVAEETTAQPDPGDAAAIHLVQAIDPPVREPAVRRLKVYAFDPSLSASQDTAAINIARLDVPWEAGLKPGPIGEYLEVIDVDPASAAAYAPVDLNHPHLLSQDGLSPTPADPRFHQQMSYAVAMKTIGHFERALGRTAMWSPLQDDRKHETFVPRLRIYPHAFRGANAYYSPSLKALLFGYFPAVGGDWRDTPEGQMTFSCLSHDIVAHETTHALLDGLHPRYRESTHPDAMALHEAFADLVALFQHFTLADAVEHQIAKSRGDLTAGAPLLQLAVEFGRASSREGAFQRALREAVDGLSDKALADLEGTAPALPDEAHDRGAMLVAAVFDAFLTLYKARQDELVLLATGGTGVLPQGRLSQPLIKALAEAAAKLAAQMMSICIRALDYCPPVDCTFGDYLRAMITADRDVVPDDPRGYRLALIAGFSKRGIFPQNVPHLSPGSMVWEAPPIPIHTVRELLPSMDLGWNRSSEREKAWEIGRQNARVLHGWLTGKTWKDGKPTPAKVKATDQELQALGLYREDGPREVDYVENGETFSETVTIGRIEVHSVRPARRAGPDGLTRSDLVVEITQRWTGGDGMQRRGGCTVLFDLETFEARYLIRKRVANIGAAIGQPAAAVGDSLAAAYFDTARDDREPFAMLHKCQ